MTRLDLSAQARPLRPRVPELPLLAPAAIATWHGRMVNETISARVFEALATQLEAAGLGAHAPPCRRHAEEERRHGVLCGAVVEALGGAARAELGELPEVPLHEDCGAIEGVLRNLLSVSCMSETVAVSLIGAERQEMPEGELRTLLTRIWADEIGHARFGWGLVRTLLPRLDAKEHARVERYLAQAFAHLEEHELACIPLEGRPGDGGEALGLCHGPSARALFVATVETVIVPGLAALGLDAERAWTSRAAA